MKKFKIKSYLSITNSDTTTTPAVDEVLEAKSFNANSGLIIFKNDAEESVGIFHPNEVYVIMEEEIILKEEI